MNMAALWKLPVIYACENNLYGEYTSVAEMAAGELLARAKPFGIESFEVDGQNVLEVNALAERLVARARNGEGPFFVVLNTYRFNGHHVGDIDRTYYRSKQEEQEWKEKRDPITVLGNWLAKEKVASDKELAAIRDEIKVDAEAAVRYALDAPYPPVNEVDMHVYAA
jgi:pyruvate dehydrogenase E1 component alpha subunit